MASGTNYSQEYGQAEKAYLESNFAQAAEIIDHLADEFPNDPNVLLLRGHIYCYGFQNYDLAKHQYEMVLNLSEEQDLLDFAHSGIEQVEQLQQQSESALDLDEDQLELTEMSDGEDVDEIEDSIGIDFPDEDVIVEDFDSGGFVPEQDYETVDDLASMDSDIDDSFISVGKDPYDNPFAEDVDVHLENIAPINEHDRSEDPFAQFESKSASVSAKSPAQEPIGVHRSSSFVDDDDDDDDLPDYTAEDFAVDRSEYENDDDDDSSELEIDTVLTEPFSMGGEEHYGMEDIAEQEGLDYQDELEFDEIDSSFFDLEELEQGLPDTGLFNVAEEPISASLNTTNDFVLEPNPIHSEEVAVSELSSAATTFAKAKEEPQIEVKQDSEEVAVSELGSTATTFAKVKEEPQIEVKQGTLGNFINAPIQKKQLITAGITGLVSAIAVLLIGLIGSNIAARQNPNRNIGEGVSNSLLLALVAGLSSAGTTAALGNITAKHITKASQNLQNQFDDVYQGNLNAKATVYSQDEFGQLASGFNRMTSLDN